jgi:hypothetical protein
MYTSSANHPAWQGKKNKKDAKRTKKIDYGPLWDITQGHQGKKSPPGGGRGQAGESGG